MIFETVESIGLAHLSYVLGDEDTGECAIVDPRRDVAVYCDIARNHQARITHILETHIHADFVSGSRELAECTGAPIYTGVSEAYRFEHRALARGDTLAVGSLSLRVLHTPGHTPEHVCFLVSGGRGAQAPWALFSGDTLFAGEVGRPDLLGSDVTETLARQLYHSLHDTLLTLEDGVQVFPAHGEGSPCGGNIGDRRSTTIGYERRHNPRLQPMDEDTFVREILRSLPPVPAYYPRLKQVNAEGPAIMGDLPGLPWLTPQQFQAGMSAPNAVVLDTREITAFGGAHIPGALNIALREGFPLWAGWLLRPEQRLLLVLEDPGAAERAQRYLARIGLLGIAGALQGGMRGWLEAGLPFEPLPQMSVHELKAHLETPGARPLQVLDVRRDDEWARGHIPTARHLFLPQLTEKLDELDRERPIVTYCGSGFRASMAASILRRNGFREVYNLPGSMKAWRAAGYPLEGAS